MSFLYPAFLWGLLAAAIPIAIHLFNFRKTKKVLFTNVSFLKEIETQKSSFRRLKHLLILLARVLAIACLAIAFAQPFLRDESQSLHTGGLTGFYIDNSFSMQNERNNKRFIDLVTASLDETMSIHSGLTSLRLITNDFAADERNLLSASQLQEKLTTTELTPVSRTFAEVYNRQKRFMESEGKREGNSWYWISDFQKSTSGDLTKLQVDSTIELNLLPVQTPEVKNIFIDSVWLETPFLREQQRNVLHVKLSSSGNEQVINLPVKLILNDKQVSATSVDIPANGTERVSFDFSISESGFIRGIIAFDDFPVTFDNQFYFVLKTSPALRILHIKSGSNLPSDPVNRVYRNDSLFTVRQAVAENLDIGQFKAADLIVLNSVEQPSQGVMAGLAQFVKEGGSVLVIPPLRADAVTLLQGLAQMGINGVRYQPAEPVAMNEPDGKIPFFQDVFEASSKSGETVNMPAAASVWSWPNVGNVLLSLRNGQPFLSQVSSGKGKVYLMSTPLDESRGNFAQHAIFVPVMYKMAAMSTRPRATSYSFDHHSLEIRVSEVSPNTVFRLRRGDSEYIPVQRLVGDNLVLELPQRSEVAGEALTPGYFDLTADGKTQEVLAVNLSRAESQLDYYSAEELRSIFAGQPNVKVFDEFNDISLKAEFDKISAGTRLWKYFLYAALAFLFLEIVLIRALKE